MSSNEIMKLARHFDWNKAKMQKGWIEADEKARLILRNSLGIDFDKTLLNIYPGLMKSTQKGTNDGLCHVCYFKLDSEPGCESFHLDECQHVFCKSCC